MAEFGRGGFAAAEAEAEAAGTDIVIGTDCGSEFMDIVPTDGSEDMRGVPTCGSVDMDAEPRDIWGDAVRGVPGAGAGAGAADAGVLYTGGSFENSMMRFWNSSTSVEVADQSAMYGWYTRPRPSTCWLTLITILRVGVTNVIGGVSGKPLGNQNTTGILNEDPPNGTGRVPWRQRSASLTPFSDMYCATLGCKALYCASAFSTSAFTCFACAN
ncbi:hypothetical protein GGI22_004513 [Coemansia erecta]|nr:hypothetical protein GGI22_004513 [Coemansia erecta]